jgi:hypothetical protein
VQCDLAQMSVPAVDIEDAPTPNWRRDIVWTIPCHWSCARDSVSMVGANIQTKDIWLTGCGFRVLVFSAQDVYTA